MGLHEVDERLGRELRGVLRIVAHHAGDGGHLGAQGGVVGDGLGEQLVAVDAHVAGHFPQGLPGEPAGLVVGGKFGLDERDGREVDGLPERVRVEAVVVEQQVVTDSPIHPCPR